MFENKVFYRPCTILCASFSKMNDKRNWAKIVGEFNALIKYSIIQRTVCIVVKFRLIEMFKKGQQ